MAHAMMQTGMGSASLRCEDIFECRERARKFESCRKGGTHFKASSRVAPASQPSPVVVAATSRCPAPAGPSPLVWGSCSSRTAPPSRSPNSSSPSCRPLLAPPCRATLDSPEIAPLVLEMVAARPAQTSRDQLAKCLAMIDEVNANDPSQVEWEGRRHPYRQLFGHWLSDWVSRLDPGAPDELFILARGKNIESWRLVEIKRDDYSPNSIGQKQWEQDRKTWLANRLTAVMKSAGYSEASCKLVEDFMLGRDLPDPRDVRLYDVTGPMGATNFRLLELLAMVQTLRDAEALVFLDKTFPRMFEELPADEVLAAVKRELAGVSKKCLATALSLPWPPLARKLLGRAVPPPPGWGDFLREVEGAAAASGHPGDWRYKDFDYE